MAIHRVTSNCISAAYSATHDGATISAPTTARTATMGFFGIGVVAYKFVSDPNISP